MFVSGCEQGTIKVGEVKPGQVLVVSGAAGATGSMVCQVRSCYLISPHKLVLTNLHSFPTSIHFHRFPPLIPPPLDPVYDATYNAPSRLTPTDR